MLKHNKTIAIVMAFVFCMSFLGAAFVMPQTAEAACTATVAESNSVPAQLQQDLGYFKVEVNVADWGKASGSELMISYPTRLGTRGTVQMAATYAALAAAVPDAATAVRGLGNSGVGIVIPADPTNALAFGDIVASTKPFDDLGGSITLQIINQTGGGLDKGWFYVHFCNIDCANFAGDVNVNLVPKSGTAFGTTPIPLVVGKVAVTGSTTTVAKSVEKITSGGGGINPLGLTPGRIDAITIFENMRNSITTGETPAVAGTTSTISLQIQTKGYSWAPVAPVAVPLMGFIPNGVPAGFGFTPIAPAAGSDTATVTVTRLAAAATTAGAVSVSGLQLVVDEKVAKIGQDVEVKVSGAGVTEQTIVVAKYVDFVATVIEDTTTELTSGLDAQKIGTFFIEEVAPGTLIEDRTILFELPAGVEWSTANIATSNYELVNNSAMTFNTGSRLDKRTLKFTVNNGSQNSQNGAKVKFKDLKVDVSPSFAGDVVLTVKGKAGVEGTAKVSTVNPMIKMNASAPEVNLGIKEQKVSDVEVVETKADTIVKKVGAVDTHMAFYLDSGFRFAKVPKVEVIEGDMVLEVNDVKIQAPANGQNLLIIPIRAASYKTPAKIKISDIYVTADRNAPVGDVILYAADTASYDNAAAAVPAGLINAFNSTGRDSFKYDTPASVAIAKNVTVPPVETKGVTGGGSGTFVIGSNIYTVNGLTKVMDAAPYIKTGRTYVPYRYLALALGVASDDIQWDADTKTVKVTKGDKVVEAVIGSTTMTVNGALDNCN